MAFISGCMCSTAIVLLLVFVMYILRHGKSRAKTPENSPISYVDDLHNETEQFLQDFTRTLSQKSKKRR